MRLRPIEIEAIRTCFFSTFHEGRIYLFGSRVDDTKKGGDIDLFLEVPDKADLFRKKIKFLARLKKELGDRRVDVVFDEDGSRLIEQEARRWAIPL
jgi:predicted nucleotidyltransferase